MKTWMMTEQVERRLNWFLSELTKAQRDLFDAMDEGHFVVMLKDDDGLFNTMSPRLVTPGLEVVRRVSMSTLEPLTGVMTKSRLGDRGFIYALRDDPSLFLSMWTLSRDPH